MGGKMKATMELRFMVAMGQWWRKVVDSNGKKMKSDRVPGRDGGGVAYRRPMDRLSF